VEPPGVGLLAADGLRLTGGIGREPGVLAQLFLVVAERPPSGRAGPAGILPFRLCQETVAVGSALPSDVIAGNLITRREPLPVGEQVAEGHGIMPGDIVDRSLIRIPFGRARVGSHDLAVEATGDRKPHALERREADLVDGSFFLPSSLFALRAAHAEGAARNRHEIDEGRPTQGGDRHRLAAPGQGRGGAEEPEEGQNADDLRRKPGEGGAGEGTEAEPHRPGLPGRQKVQPAEPVGQGVLRSPGVGHQLAV